MGADRAVTVHDAKSVYSALDPRRRTVFLTTLGFHLSEVVRSFYDGQPPGVIDAFRAANEVMQVLWKQALAELHIHDDIGYPPDVVIDVIVEKADQGHFPKGFSWALDKAIKACTDEARGNT